jgi:hypothetical protein
MISTRSSKKIVIQQEEEIKREPQTSTLNQVNQTP